MVNRREFLSRTALVGTALACAGVEGAVVQAAAPIFLPPIHNYGG